MSRRPTVGVFCASSEAVPARYRTVAAALGRALVGDGWALVYGGGGIGLMGEVARAALAAGGHVTGVIPRRLDRREIALDSVTELLRTDTMRERKALMDERSDAFVVLPGGIGTLEELVEIVTLKQLGYHGRPIVLLDPDGYWAALAAQIEHMVATGLAAAELRTLFVTTTTVTGAVEALAGPAAQGHPTVAAELEAVEGPPQVLGGRSNDRNVTSRRG